MKYLVLFLFTVFTLTFASKSIAQTLFVKAGPNYSSQFFKSDIPGYPEGIRWKPGFTLGVMASIPLTHIVSFQTGLSLVNRGYKQSQAQGGALDIEDVKNTVNLYYAELPFDIKGISSIGNTKIFAILGPYIGLGLWGKEKSSYLFRGAPRTENTTISWGTDPETDTYKRLDIGLNAGLGIEVNLFQIGLDYGLGLSSISPVSNSVQRINNTDLTLYVAYRLGKK